MPAAVPPLLVFMALLLVLSLYGLAAAGHFPPEHRGHRLRSPAGSLILFGSIALALVCLGTAVVVAWQHLPWYAAVIGGGVMVLIAPLLLRPLPDSFVDGPGALIAFAAAGVLLAALLISIT
jgi:hypothetical protein